MFTPVAVMEMLAGLHRLGYERLRLSAGMSPTGLNWRYSVAPVDQFEPNGYLLRGGLHPGAAFGTTRGDDAPFGWEGAEDASPRQLVDMFLKRFPEIAAAGRGQDASYVTWFEAALEASRPDGALIMFGEYVDVAQDGFMMTGDTRLALPPAAPDTRTTPSEGT